jgi:hypothetical protein
VRIRRTRESSSGMKLSAMGRICGPRYRLAAVIAAMVSRNCASPSWKKPPSFLSRSGESCRPG